MKITFPHMGNIYLGVKALFDGLGVDYIIPPQNSKLSLEIGSLHSPEEICLPFKLMIGNYIQAIEQGADTIILPGSCGPCRFGEYCEMQMMLLKRLGYNLDFIVIDAPTDIGIKELYNRISKISSISNKPKYKKFKSLFDAIKVMNLIDEIEAATHNFAGYEKTKGECKSILNKCKEDAFKCDSPKEMIKVLLDYKEKINHVSIDINMNPLKIAIIGEIYTVIDVRTIIEIGGQDSKIIVIKNGVVSDFAMNTVCAAGTGSFLDRQAERLDIPIEEFGNYALKAKSSVRIAGRCAVFAESDMIHKQSLGYNDSEIIRGLCDALVRNYLNNIGKGKEIVPKVFFQGGVAANKGMKKAFENALGFEIFIPEHYNMMGAIGAAIIAKTAVEKKGSTNFKGFNLADSTFITKSFDCEGCSNKCEVVKITENNNAIGYFGDRCGKWCNKLIPLSEDLLA